MAEFPHHYVSSTNKLQAWLENRDVQDVNKVTQVVGHQPVVDITRSLIGEGPADWDEPNVPVPGQGNQEHPKHIH